ncbi:MAG: RND family transporter, partial [Pseudomonadota bacterium]
MNSFFESYARTIIRFRFVVVLVMLGLALWAASGARFITFTNDYRYFFSDQNPNLAAFEKLQRTYTRTDTVLWVLRPTSGDVNSPDMMR